jgi:hypothetical protein
MAQPLRIEYPGAWYHVIARGNGKKPIFRQEEDLRHFLDLIEESDHRNRLRIHCYTFIKELGEKAGGMNDSSVAMAVHRIGQKLQQKPELTRAYRKVNRLIVK